MKKQIQNKHKELLQKQAILDQAATTLKKEFVGIDPVIDELIEAISSWYLFPEIQEKPVVVNLWGLTGVGKSSLVNRLSDLIHYKEKYYHFDLGENGEKYWLIKKTVEEIYEYENGFPIMIAFDEFQHARTLDQSGFEMDKAATQIVWQLLDSGKFQITKSNPFAYEHLFNLVYNLQYMLNNGVKVAKGMVTRKKELFLKQMDLQPERHMSSKHPVDKTGNLLMFVPANYHESIFELSMGRFKCQMDVADKLMGLNGQETIQFLKEVLVYAKSPKTVDCSKALIFVLGNLDEAYTMSHDFNPDMDADTFHMESLKISVPEIKHVLQKRFRNEQIARLGNLHIIYPAFSRDSYEQIIQMELSKVTAQVLEQQNFTIQFDQSIHELIYQEGVYPTQGVRPVLTTIHQIIKTKLGKVITEMIMKEIEVKQVRFSVKGNKIIIDYLKSGKVLHSFQIKQQLNLTKLRKNTRDDMQSIVAVHESGHAIVAAILLKIIPNKVYSISASSSLGGFVQTDLNWKFIARKDIIKRIALYMGGMAAEKIVFGNENLTCGAAEDLEHATTLVTDLLKSRGMGSTPAFFQAKSAQTRYALHDPDNEINTQAKELLIEGMRLAETTLNKQEVLLLRMADYLSDNRSMDTGQIRKMIDQYARGFDMHGIIENNGLLFYRNHLKKKVSKLDMKPVVQLNGNPVSFNNVKMNG
jgi:Peptidase family M41/C-terminal, D2-small domain, of ClpB protein